MQLSVELSYYPLQLDYKPAIVDFIQQMQAQGRNIQVESNRMSSYLFGDYDEVMGALKQLMKVAFCEEGTAVFIAKFVNSDRRPKTGESAPHAS